MMAEKHRLSQLTMLHIATWVQEYFYDISTLLIVMNFAYS